MANQDSFFGFDTRLPEHRASQSQQPARVPSAVRPDQFDELNDDFPNLNLDDLDAPENYVSNDFDRTGLFPKSNDPWSKTAVSELDEIDSRDFFTPTSADPLTAGFFSRTASSPSLTSNAWSNNDLPNYFDKKDADEERITDTLSRLMDEDSFSTGNIRDDFYNSLSKQPFGTSSSSLTSAVDSTSTLPGTNSIWGPGSSPFGQPSYWGAEKDGRDAGSPASTIASTTSRLSERWDTATTAKAPEKASKQFTNKTPMTLEELEGILIPKASAPPSLPVQHEPRSLRASPRTNVHAQRPDFPPGFRMPLQSRGRMMPPAGDFMRDPQMSFGGAGRLPNNRPMMMNMHHMPIGGPLNHRFVVPPFHLPPGYRGARPMNPMFRMPPGMHHHPPGMGYGHQQQYRNVYDRDEEEDVGWMTEREKEWVIKIQQSQVKTENPYMDDYYHYVRSMKKSAARQVGAGKVEQDFIIPARMAPEPKEERPNFFEGSLGKVCISSVFNPRRTVDVEAMNIAKSRAVPVSTTKRRWFVDPLQKDMGTPKGLLLGIEELYKLIIELQDFTREIAAMPQEQRNAENETRRNIVNMIFGRLLQGTTPETRLRSFCDIIKIRKGREVLRRALPILFPEQIVILIGFCVRAMPILVDASVERHEEFLRCLVPVDESLSTTNLKSVVDLITPLVEIKHGIVDGSSNIFTQIIKSKFAMNFLALLIARGEALYDAESEGLDEERSDKWTLLITHFFVNLTRTPASEVALIVDKSIREAVAAHIGRFPFSVETLEACREKLRKPSELTSG